MKTENARAIKTPRITASLHCPVKKFAKDCRNKRQNFSTPAAWEAQGVKEAPVHLVAGKFHKEIRETEQDNVGVELSLIHI